MKNGNSVGNSVMKNPVRYITYYKRIFLSLLISLLISSAEAQPAYLNKQNGLLALALISALTSGGAHFYGSSLENYIDETRSEQEARGDVLSSEYGQMRQEIEDAEVSRERARYLRNGAGALTGVFALATALASRGKQNPTPQPVHKSALYKQHQELWNKLHDRSKRADVSTMGYFLAEGLATRGFTPEEKKSSKFGTPSFQMPSFQEALTLFKPKESDTDNTHKLRIAGLRIALNVLSNGAVSADSGDSGAQEDGVDLPGSAPLESQANPVIQEVLDQRIYSDFNEKLRPYVEKKLGDAAAKEISDLYVQYYRQDGMTELKNFPALPYDGARPTQRQVFTEEAQTAIRDGVRQILMRNGFPGSIVPDYFLNMGGPGIINVIKDGPVEEYDKFLVYHTVAKMIFDSPEIQKKRNQVR